MRSTPADPEIAERYGARCRHRAGNLHAGKGMRLPPVAVLLRRRYAGEIAHVGQEILRPHDIRGRNADGLANRNAWRSIGAPRGANGAN